MTLQHPVMPRTINLTGIMRGVSRVKRWSILLKVNLLLTNKHTTGSPAGEFSGGY